MLSTEAQFNEILLNDCFIGGSEKVKTDDGLFLGVSAKLAELIEVKESELEKLRRKGIGMDKVRGG